MIQVLQEAKDLKLYKKILNLFGDYVDRYPATGVSKMFKQICELGMKTVPKDKRAQQILWATLAPFSGSPDAVTKILNLRFSDIELADGRPIYQCGRTKEVAFWKKGDQVSDKVLSLLNLDGESGAGTWTTAKGEKVKLIDMVQS